MRDELETSHLFQANISEAVKGGMGALEMEVDFRRERVYKGLLSSSTSGNRLEIRISWNNGQVKKRLFSRNLVK